MALTAVSCASSNRIHSEVLNHIWTGTADLIHYQTVFRIPASSLPWDEAEYRSRRYVILWDALCSLSRTCKAFRRLCLPRMFGTILLGTCKAIGQLSKSLQCNPSLGSYTHSCRVQFQPFLWPRPFFPSQAMESMFTVRDMTNTIEELKLSNPGGLDPDTARRLRRYSGTGPDGKGFDANIENPTDFKRALQSIFFSFTSLNTLIWRSRLIPVYSSIINHLNSVETLEVLHVPPGACEEDHLRDADCFSSEKLPDPTPIWKLSKRLSQVGIVALFEPFRMEEDIGSNWLGRNPALFQRQCQVFIKLIKEAKNLKSIDLGGFYYVGKEGSRPDVLASILPILACVPVNPKNRMNNEYSTAIQAFHPQIEQLAERSGILSGAIIQAFGKECSEANDHPLLRIAGLLQEEKLSEEIATEWNRRSLG